VSSIDALINRQFKIWEAEKTQRAELPQAKPAPPFIVTVSREHGSRGAFFAAELAARLGYQLMHREIIDAITQSSGYRRRMIESLDEHYRSDIELAVETILTRKAIDYDDYVRYLCHVVLSMAKLGGVVLVGRGGNFIIGPDQGFHIRVIGPEKKRIENLVKYRSMTNEEAKKAIEEHDSDRREMIKKLFKADIDDPHHYDLVVNVGHLEIEQLTDHVMDLIEKKRGRMGG
jgi:cytidylate kinase